MTADNPETEPAPVKQTSKIGQGKPGPGRPKGQPNKTTALLKDAILQAATDAGEGDMAAYLRIQAIANPGPFMALLGKVLPMQIGGDPDGTPIEVVTRIERAIVKNAADSHG